MSDMLQVGATWLAGKTRSFASQTITYKRGLESVSLPAMFGHTEYSQTDDRGIVTQFRSHDWLVSPADLTLGLPEKGDRIEVTIGGVAKVFEVLDLSGVNHFDPVDYDTKLRIHTKEIG